ncbi:response regulator transcription factor [Paenibacillus thalictri]|uniref:Response regulator n=1 Tax=Paenibacillus thalictri TaxID=2527873 RepID=A0A4Q9DSP3_9BACL|nr:response regulator [Paenibacillus thalictri]TBL79106.1 response regulator [Paenibacillus thalictri]
MYSILIIDDEEWIRQGILSKVRKSGFPFTEIAEAANAEEGFSIIKTLQPDIVVCDIRMEEMDGLELIEKVHRMYPEIKTIIISGYSEFQYVTKALKLGVADYLLKPIDKYALYQAFTKCMEAIEQEKQAKIRIEKLELVGSSLEMKQKMDKFLQKEDLDPREIFSAYNDRSSFQSVSLFVDPGTNEEDIILNHFLDSQGSLQLNRNMVCYKNTPHEFTILICVPEPHMVNEYENYIVHYIERLQTDLHKNGVYRYTFGISGFHQRIDTCIFAASYCLKHRVLLEDNQVIRYTDTMSFQQTYKLASHVPAFLKHHLETQNIKGITDIISDIYQEISVAAISYKSVQNLYTHLLMVAAEDFNVNLETQYPRYPLEAYFYSSLRELLDSITELYLKIVNVSKGRSEYSTQRLIMRVKEYIDTHYAEEIKLEDIAELEHYNSSYLSLAFKETMNINFQDYLLNVRLGNAKKMLLSGQYKIKDIAVMSGFKNPHYFSAVFKKAEGFTPKDFVKEHGEGLL